MRKLRGTRGRLKDGNGQSEPACAEFLVTLFRKRDESIAADAPDFANLVALWDAAAEAIRLA